MIKISELIAPSFYDIHKFIKEDRYTHYWLGGGRGSTKSSFVSVEVVFNMMKDAEANAVCLRKIGNTLESSVFNQILWAIEKLGVSQYWQIKKSPMEMTYLPYGNKIIFRSSDDPVKLKSIKFVKGYAKYIWYEEITEFFGMEEVRSINQSLLRGGDKFSVFYTYNPPKSMNNWVNQEVLEKRDDKIFHKSTYLDVPKEWLGPQFIIEAEHLKATKLKEYENEYLGEITGTGGAVFDNVIIREITDEEISHFDKIKDGIDFGFAVDPSVYTQNHFDKTRRILYIFNEIYEVGLSNKMLWERIIKKKISHSQITADSAEPKSIAELNALGQVQVLNAKKGPDSVEYGMKWLQKLDQIIIDNVRCPNTAKEFISYEYERDREGNFISRYPDKNNHSIDATRYSREQDMKSNTINFGFNTII